MKERAARATAEPRPGQDLITLDEVAARLKLTAKTVRRLHHERGLPLIRLSAGGGYFGLWSVIEQWARSQVAEVHSYTEKARPRRT